MALVGQFFRRTGRTVDYSVEEAEVAAVASYLARGVVGGAPMSAGEFERAVARGDQAVRRLVVFVSHVERRRRRLLADVDEAIRSGPSRPRWLRTLLGQAYALYNVIRSVVAPQGGLVPLQLASGTHIARALHRELRRRAVASGAVHSAEEIRRLADDTVRQRWDEMRGKQVVVWFDNFYRQHFGHNPALIGLQHLNATVVNGLVLPFELPVYPGLAEVPQLVARGNAWAQEVVRYYRVFWQQVESITEHDLAVEDFRVPLDLARGPVRPVQWFPLLLSQKVVQRNDTLVELLAMFAVVRDHCRTPLPLLVDLDVWYRLVKLAFGERTQRWDVAGVLRTMPPLYGVWHPYKYTLTLVYRQFHSFFCALKNGEVEETFQCSAVVDIRAVELFIAALLVIPGSERRAVQAAMRRVNTRMQAQAQRVVDCERAVRREQSALARAEAEYNRRMQGLEERSRRDRPLHRFRGGEVEITDARVLSAKRQHEAALEELVRLRDRKNQLMALYLLLAEYAPACLLLGYLVRDCHWRHRDRGSGGSALKVLQASLLMQMALVEKPQAVEYVRTLCVALVNWRAWNDEVPGYAYAEEANEAGLSRLGTQCASHPRHLDVPQVMDLYLAFVKPPRAEEKDLRSHAPTGELVDKVRRNLAAIVRVDRPLKVRYVPFKSVSARLLHAEPEWPSGCFLPRPLNAAPDLRTVQALFRYELNVLIRQVTPLSDVLVQALDAHVPVRPGYMADQRRDDLSKVLFPAEQR